MSKIDPEIRKQYIVPTWCPLCSRIMKYAESNKSWHRFGCCHNCFIAFVEGREEKWKSGWRPTTEQIESYYSKL